MEPDEELRYLKNLQSGDLQAVETLVNEHYPALYNFLLRLGCPASEAEDILQETFIKVIRGLKRYQHNGQFRAWLFKICHNSYHDFCKKASQRREFPHDPYTLEPHPNPSPETLTLEMEHTRQVQQTLQRLPSRQRLVIVLRYYHEFSLREIAQVVGCPVGTVKSRLNNALKTLRKIIEEEDAG